MCANTPTRLRRSLTPLRSADTGDSKTLGGEGTSTRLGNQESLMDLEQPYCQPFRAHLLLLFCAADMGMLSARCAVGAQATCSRTRRRCHT